VNAVDDKTGAPPAQPAADAQGALLRDLLTRLVELKKEIERYARVTSAAVEGRHLDADQMLRRAPKLSFRLTEALAKTAEQIREYPLEGQVRDAARRARLGYHEALERLLDDSDLPCSGQWPSYTIADVLRLQVDLERGEATLNGKALGTVEPTRIVEHVTARLAELLDRPFDAADFLSLLRAAHEQTAAAQGRSFGEYVDIREVFAAVRAMMEQSGRDRRYSEAKFGADLYRLYRDGRPTTPEGLTLELSPAQNAAGGLYIPARGGGNYIAALRFQARPANG
jgi:hypothetical protein